MVKTLSSEGCSARERDDFQDCFSVASVALYGPHYPKHDIVASVGAAQHLGTFALQSFQKPDFQTCWRAIDPAIVSAAICAAAAAKASWF